jgi:hypothetical protein
VPANCSMVPAMIAGALLAMTACSRSSSTARSARPPDDTASAPVAIPAAPEPSFAVTCAPAFVTAGLGRVTCTATPASAGIAIEWSLSGPGALSTSRNESVDYAPPERLDADATARVVAAAAGLTASFEVHVLRSARLAPRVSGHVVDAEGYPVAGIVARVAGHEAATTDEAGAFTISGVQPPYDLVLSTLGPGRTAQVYAGLTRADPTVALYRPGLAAADGLERRANLAGQVMGGDPAGVGDSFQGVLFASAGLPSRDPLDAVGVAIAPPPSSYEFPVSWRGASTLHGAMLAVQWRSDPGTAAPTAYWHATAPDVEVADGATAAVPLLELAATPVVTTKGTVRLPPDYAMKLVLAQWAPATQGPAFSLFYDDNGGAKWGAPPIFHYVLPVLDGASLQLCARAVSTAARRGDSVAMGCVDACGLAAIDVVVRAAPEPLAPANGANAVGLDTVFAWQPVPEGVHVLEVTPDGPDAPTFLVVTAASSATLPNLGESALGLPSGASYHWRVRGFAPVANLDALAAPGAAPLPLDYPSPHGPRWAWGRSTAYQFIVR